MTAIDRSPTTGNPPTLRPFIHTIADAVAFPHGYTLLIWATTMATVWRHGLPDVVSIFAMLAGACAAYLAVGSIGRHLIHAREDREARHVVILLPYMVAIGNFVTLAAATGACLATSLVGSQRLAWLLTGLVGTSVYLGGLALQAFVVATKRLQWIVRWRNKVRERVQRHW